MISHKSKYKIKIKDIPIAWSNTIRCLGVQIDKWVTFSKHVNYSADKAYVTRRKLFPLFNSKSPYPVSTKTYIYNTYIHPILIYAAPIWYSNLLKLKRVQSNALRTITGYHRLISDHSVDKKHCVPL